ncbi:FAD/NAD(P)-binding domain-containing protein [Calocera viscosa TUFC12733]|uniref:FAD/NAD(P)-binding domain-containing protein n=1 Tax=Calocera viscosa (strain TUFC12733) TaxID=1330018 RepID=A0A167JY87_CALVF|nr:FAD/NAD(P)-binding domain-containing protein [Calocera viscosa TUFC12733]
MSAAPKHVLIIGAGLGGTALAIGLSQRGIKATLYELRPSRGTIGGAVALAPNALRVLDRLGVYSTIRTQGWNFEKTRFINEHGKLVGDFHSGGTQFGYQALRIKREKLLQALHETAQAAGVEILFSKKAVRVSEDEGSATVEFADGSSATADFVVGFDGLHSLIREHVTGPGVVAKYTGFTGIGFSAPKSAINFPTDVYSLPCMILGRRGTCGMMPSDVEGQEVGCFSTCHMEKDLGREGWDEFAREKAIPWIQEVHKDWEEPVKSMMSSLDPTAVHIWPQYELPPVPAWHSARVAIAGDAVHAMSPNGGQGSAQAFEDGALLARALSLVSSEYPLERALRNWESARRERIIDVLAFTHRSSDTRKQSSWAGQVVKEWGMWAFFSLKGESSAGLLNNYDAEKVDLTTLE